MEVQIIGIHTPSSLIAAQRHPFALADDHEGSVGEAVRSTATTSISAVKRGETKYEHEVGIVGQTVFSSRAGLTSTSYTSVGSEGGRLAAGISQAFHANFRVDDDAKTPKRTGNGPSTQRRALAVFHPSFITLHFDSGVSQDVPIPYHIERAWPLSRGILVQRRREHGEADDTPILYSLTHPLDNFRPVEIKINKVLRAKLVAMRKAQTHTASSGKYGGLLDDILMVSEKTEEDPWIVTYDRDIRSHAIWLYNFQAKQASDPAAQLSEIIINPAAYAKTALKPEICLQMVWYDPEVEDKWVEGGRAKDVFMAQDYFGCPRMYFLAPSSSINPNQKQPPSADRPPCDRPTGLAGSLYKLTVLTIDLSQLSARGSAKCLIRFADDVLGAVPLKATRAKARDVLMLHKDNTMKLWTGYERCIPCELPAEIIRLIPPVKRQRSEDGTEDVTLKGSTSGGSSPSPPFLTGSRITGLSQAADDCVNLLFSTGENVRVSLNFRPKSTLVARCLEAMYYAGDPALFGAFQLCFLKLHYGPKKKWKIESTQHEWTDFVTALLSFCQEDAVSRRVKGAPSDTVPDQYMAWLKQRTQGRRKVGRVHFQDVSLSSAFIKARSQEQHVEQSRGWILRVILLFHVVYEDLKLDTLMARCLPLLGDLLFHLARMLRWEEYVQYYRIDGFTNVATLTNDVVNREYPVECEVPPVDIYSWVLNKLKGSEQSASALQPVLDVVSTLFESDGSLAKKLCRDRDEECSSDEMLQSENEEERDEMIQPDSDSEPRRWQRTPDACPDPRDFLHKTSIHRICGYYLTLVEKGARAVVATMVNGGFGKGDLETMPLGLSLPLKQAVENCRTNPPGNWSEKAYTFIGREDLAQQFELRQPPHISQSALVTQSSNPRVSAESGKVTDGTESVVTDICTLRFCHDRRVDDVRRMVQAARPTVAKVEVDYNASEEIWKAEQQRHLWLLSQRILAFPAGRGPLTLGTVTPTLTEAFNFPELVVAARFPPMNATVPLEVIKVPHNPIGWPEFHNGVAAGLSIEASCQAIDGAWIVYNTPIGLEEGKRSLACKHAGFLLGLGLMGNLKKMNLYDLIDYMNLKQDVTAIALLLGLGATHIGTRDMRHTRLCYSHIELAADMAGRPTGTEVKPAAVIAVGLLYMGSLARLHSEKILYLLQNIEQESPEVPEHQRGSCALACGFALGFITLGGINSPQAAGIADIHLGDRLLKFALGKSRPYIAISATVALGLTYLKTGDTAVANKLSVPETPYLLNRVRPDILLLRILSRSLIMWDTINPTRDWANSHIPEYIRNALKDAAPDSDGEPLDLYRQARWNLLAGACFAIGLKFAGSHDELACETLMKIVREFSGEYFRPATTFSRKLDRTIVRGCLDVLVTSLCLIMAGSGDVEVLKLVRHLHYRAGPDVTYGNHTATNMALGFLFLAGGSCTFGTSNRAVATLVCALFPQYPVATVNNRGHIHAARHLWALAVERRCLVTRDVETRQMCSVPIVVKVLDKTSDSGVRLLNMTTPALLPAYKDIVSITTDSPRYWPNTLDVAVNPKHSDLLIKSATLYVKRKLRHLSYLEDPHGSHTSAGVLSPHEDMRSHSLRDTSPKARAHSLIKAYPRAPDISAFATYMCSAPGTPTDLRKSFLTTVLKECVNLDRPDVMLPYLCLHQLLSVNTFSPSGTWNAKLILAFYQGGYYRDIDKDVPPESERPFLSKSYVNRMSYIMDDYFRKLEHQVEDGSDDMNVQEQHHDREIAEETDDGPHFFTSLRRFLEKPMETNDDGHQPPDVLAKCRAYLIYREWPRLHELRWIRKSLHILFEPHTVLKFTQLRKSLEIAIALRFPRLQRRTIQFLLDYLTTAPATTPELL
ncbi:hypothetical protein PhCBS80983_g01241 [Powellomyces hirtus]|uniref:Uncharacterized protein n=1 Tax=Powellomyces hirtus TaxID=109895 RepID=A0A507EBP4_9FUNG|nr:hypothetical protein PhCBS80983_g01241 [Powellomyces hirtus]